MMKGYVYCALMVLLIGCETTSNHDHPAMSLIRIARKTRLGGNSEAALKFYNKAIEIAPDLPEGYLGAAEVYIDMKLLDAADEAIKQAEKRGGKPSKVAYLKGKILLLQGKIKEAAAYFKKYETPDCLNALGTVYDSLGDHKKARSLYKKVIAMDPKYIDAYNNMGMSLFLDNDYNGAIFYLENACSLPDASVAYRSNLAFVYGLTGQISKARAIYSQDFEDNEVEKKIMQLEDIIARKSDR